MLISIIMPVHNAEPYLEECLQSIRGQSYEQWELLAVDDGSTDESHVILAKYASIDARINIWQQPKLGIIAALQKGYQSAKGTLITRMDADDHMPKQKLRLMHQSWEAHGKGHLITGRVAYFSDKPLGEGYLKYTDWLNNLVKTRRHFEAIYRECVIPSCAWLIHRSDFENCGGFDGKHYPEDYDLTFRFYQQGIRVVALDELLHFWRDHAARSSRNDPNYLDNNFLQLKLRYFLQIELKEKEELTLWGAGKKGKALAQMLVNQSISFRWITNNEQKQSKDIHGVVLESDQLALNSSNNAKIIIAVANEEEQAEIRARLAKLKFKEGSNCFFFA